MKEYYPLLFTFRDVVSGNGFLSGITLSGRMLMTKEDDGKWWGYGVRPAALAASGNTPQEAHYNFKNRYKEVLFDIAQEVATFDSFRDEVERFYYEPDQEEEGIWEAAVQAVRSGALVPEGPFSALPKQAPEERPSSISVERLDHQVTRYAATDNVPDLFATAA